MKRQTIWVVSLLGLAFLSGGSVFARGGGGGGKGIQDRVRDPSAVVQQDRLRTQDKDQLRTLDKDPLRTWDRDQLRTPDQDQLKLRDQDRDRLHVPQ